MKFSEGQTMKSELIYHGKYYQLDDNDHLEIIPKEKLGGDSTPNLLGFLVKYVTTGIPVMGEPSYTISILEGEGCPIEGFPPYSTFVNINGEIPF